MKKSIAKVLAVIFVAAIGMTLFTACTPRNETLRIYNWGEYMDETVIDSFKEWYEGEYGTKIKVEYREYDGNETLYTNIVTQEQDWDLACPSDYMIDKLIKENMLLEISSKVDRRVINQDLLDMTDTYDKGAKFSIPYIWGTFGIMYDTTKITSVADQAKMESWAALWDESFANKIYMKNQVRDSYCVAMLYHYKDQLKSLSNNFTDYTNAAYQQKMIDIFTKFDDAEKEKAKVELIKQRKVLYKYESDDGKIDMASGNSNAALGMFWSCDSGYVMNDYEMPAVGCIGAKSISGNKNLAYVVPKEGSNVWVDGWVIPKFSKNKETAEIFINYLLTEEVSKLNASYAGAPAANAKAMDELKAEIEKDEDGFFTGTRAGFKEMYLEMMFPTQETLNRCQIMGDFGSMYGSMLKMFEEVKMA